MKITVMIPVLVLSVSLFNGDQAHAAEGNPRKELAKVTRQFVKEAKSSGYRFDVHGVGGTSDSENHVLNRKVAWVRTSGYSLNHLMYLPTMDAYISSEKGAIEHEGYWRSIYSIPRGRLLKSMVSLPEELLMEALRSNSKVTWEVEGQVLNIDMHKSRSNRLFSEVNTMSTMDRGLYLKHNRKKRTIPNRTKGSIQVEIDPETKHVKNISMEILVACKDALGRSPKAGVEYSEGTEHVVYRLDYDIRTGSTVEPVEPMNLSTELKNILN